MRKINEIFYSIQGEGCRVGIPSVFVRFSGCNLKCDFCDTNHQHGVWMTDENIIKEINKYPAKQVVLTGGEPTLQIDENFIKSIHIYTNKEIAIETNGTKKLPDGIDWITVSPKTGMGGGLNENVNIEYADELKVVDIGQDLNQYFLLPCLHSNTQLLLQPCFVPDPIEREKNTQRTVIRVLEDPRWRLSLQTHKFLNIR